MCSYDTTQIALEGSAKRESGWTGISGANIYYACPYYSKLEDTLNIDFVIKDNPQQRVALELSAESAIALAHAILGTLEKEMHDHDEIGQAVGQARAAELDPAS